MRRGDLTILGPLLAIAAVLGFILIEVLGNLLGTPSAPPPLAPTTQSPPPSPNSS
jgi:hypothetical protein